MAELAAVVKPGRGRARGWNRVRRARFPYNVTGRLRAAFIFSFSRIQR